MTPLVVLVVTPGVALEAYGPLLDGLRAGGADPVVVSFPCSGDAASMAARVHQVVAAAARPPVVVAHGLGATVALAAAPGLEVERWVLLAPVLDVVPVASTTWLAGLEVGPAVHLEQALAWHGHDDVRPLLLGADLPPLGCVSAGLARDVQGWIRAADVPLPLEQVTAPVWLGIGLLDAVSPPEAVVPASRRLPRRTLVRFGVNRLDPDDYDHLGLLTEPPPVRAAVKAALEGP